MLIDFGSAAPLLPPSPTGSQQISESYCLVPCGTCDYIAPEILEAAEQALVLAEIEDSSSYLLSPALRYGREIDWWSYGAMLYELSFGIAPFFSDDIKQTYQNIVQHEVC
jgi:serine/threonine protein kinase